MTAEELTKEYLKDESKWLVEDAEGNLINITKKVEAAYRAGLEASRIEWHSVDKEALPDNFRYVWTNVGAGYHDEDGWRDSFGRLQGVVAWCEPKFEQEQ